MEVHLDDVFVRGMKEIKDGDMELAEGFGYTVKLVGSAEIDEDGIAVAVEPVLFPNSHPLASVNNEYNAVYIYGDAVGETMLYGPGAGSFQLQLLSQRISLRHVGICCSVSMAKDSMHHNMNGK